LKAFLQGFCKSGRKYAHVHICDYQWFVVLRKNKKVDAEQ